MIQTMEQQTADVTQTAPYWPLFKWARQTKHANVPGRGRTALAGADLSERYWEYTVRHMTECRDLATHRATGKYLTVRFPVSI